jgi:hypothetical protein
VVVLGQLLRLNRARAASSSRTVARSTPSSSAHRSSGAAIGRPTSRSCQVPTEEPIEHLFEDGSGTLRSPTGPLTARAGRAGAATRRNLGDSKGQQGITNLEVSGRPE